MALRFPGSSISNDHPDVIVPASKSTRDTRRSARHRCTTSRQALRHNLWDSSASFPSRRSSTLATFRRLLWRPIAIACRTPTLRTPRRGEQRYPRRGASRFATRVARSRRIEEPGHGPFSLSPSRRKRNPPATACPIPPEPPPHLVEPPPPFHHPSR